MKNKKILGPEISYFGSNHLSFLQFRPGCGNSKNCSELSSGSKKVRILFF